MKKLNLVLLVFAFIIGFQSFCEAQMTVVNNSTCTIYAAVVQENMTTGQRCDFCGATNFRAIAPGSSRVFQADSSCGLEFWNSIVWKTNPQGSSSTSYNPFYQGTCLPDSYFVTCVSGVVLTPSWVQTIGGGATQVTIQ